MLMNRYNLLLKEYNTFICCVRNFMFCKNRQHAFCKVFSRWPVPTAHLSNYQDIDVPSLSDAPALGWEADQWSVAIMFVCLFVCWNKTRKIVNRESNHLDRAAQRGYLPLGPCQSQSCQQRTRFLVRIKIGRDSNWLDGQIAVFVVKIGEEIFWFGKQNLRFNPHFSKSFNVSFESSRMDVRNIQF